MSNETESAATIARAQALHCDDGTGWCQTEPFTKWPCDTARALDPGAACSTQPAPGKQRVDLLRALDRAHALAEQWDGDRSPIAKSEAARLLSAVLQLHGWAQRPDPPAVLRVVPPIAEVLGHADDGQWHDVTDAPRPEEEAH